MDRRQVLAGLAASLTLGSGCLESFDSNGGNRSTTDKPGTRDKRATETESPAATGTEKTTAQTATRSSQSALVDTANLTTYTRGSYSIKRPADWRVAEATPQTVRITDPDSPARMLIRVKDGVASFISREIIITTAIERAKRQYSLDQVTRTDQREVTLSNGTPATLVKTRMHRSTTDRMLRGTFLVAHVSDTAYAAGIFVPERGATPSVEEAMTRIVTSLTVQ